LKISLTHIFGCQFIKIKHKKHKNTANKVESDFSWFEEGESLLGDHGSFHEGFLNVLVDSLGDLVVFMDGVTLLLGFGFVLGCRFLC
jgi:hypothetical protein